MFSTELKDESAFGFEHETKLFTQSNYQRVQIMSYLNDVVKYGLGHSHSGLTMVGHLCSE